MDKPKQKSPPKRRCYACYSDGCLNCVTYGYPCLNCVNNCEPFVNLRSPRTKRIIVDVKDNMDMH